MKSLFIRSILLTSILTLPMAMFWATEESASGAVTETTTVASTWFFLSGVTVEDDMHVRLDFTENIVIESVRIRIAKQTDGTNIKVESLTGIIDQPNATYVTLVDLLEAGEAYTITVISALSDKGVTITEWTDALSEFSAPDPLKESMVVFNAPPNPSATTTESVVEPVEEVEDTTVAADTATTDEPPVPKSEELPLTGMNPIFFLIASAVLAFAIITLRRKAS